MKKLVVLMGMMFLLASCVSFVGDYRDCRHVAIDSFNRGIDQGYNSRIVTGKMWPSGKPLAFIWDQPVHAEAQVRINGEWCFVDNGTGQPLTGWYGKMLEPGMYITKIYPTIQEFVKDEFDREDAEYKRWFSFR